MLKRWMILGLAMCLLAASLACGRGAGGADVAVTPTTTTSEAALAASTPTAPPPTSAPEPQALAVALGELQRNEDGGFAFQVVPGYELVGSGGSVTMLAPDADPDLGPVVSLLGWVNAEAKTVDDLYAELRRDTTMAVDEAEPIMVQGLPGLAAEITGDNGGTAMRGRAALLMVTPLQQFVLLAGAPADQWDALAPYFDAVLASLTFFEPTVVLPTSDLAPGWYAHVNSNVVRDLVVHEEVIYAATLGGVVARDLDGGYVWGATPLDGVGHVSAHAVAACEIFGEERLVVGTLKGLSLFDPVSGVWDATPIAPEESRVATSKVTRLYCDREQRWLLIGYSGLGVLDIDAGDFVRFTDKEGLSWNAISDIAVNGSEIWVASGYNGITQIRGDQVTVHNVASGMPDERAHALAFAPDGTLWVGGSKGLMAYSGGQWTLYEEVKEINEIEIAADGTLWLATAPLGSGRLCRFDSAAGTCLVDQRDADGFPILALALDAEGRAVYGTNQALTIYDTAQEQAQAYRQDDDQLATNFVDGLATDADGMLWVGTDGGIQVLDPAAPELPWTTYRQSDTPGLGGSWGREIAVAADGTVWVAVTNGDASRFRDGAWLSFEGLRSYETVAVDAQGRAWFGDDGKGIVVLDAEGAQVMQLTTAEGLPSDKVQALLADGDTIWVALDMGVARVVGGTPELVLDKATLPHPYLRALALDADGALLIGANLSIVRYDGAQAEVLYNFQQEGYMDWLTHLAVAPDGRIWAGTANGLFYTDDGAAWTRLTTADGLLTNFISALHVDPYGALWVGGGGSNYDGGGLLQIVGLD